MTRAAGEAAVLVEAAAATARAAAWAEAARDAVEAAWKTWEAARAGECV